MRSGNTLVSKVAMVKKGQKQKGKIGSRPRRRLQNHTQLSRKFTLAPYCLPPQFQQRPNMKNRPKYASVMLCHGACIGRRKAAPRRISVTASRPRRVVAGTSPNDSIATAASRGRRRHSGRRSVCSAPLGTVTVLIGPRRWALEGHDGRWVKRSLSPRPRPRAANRGCVCAL